MGDTQSFIAYFARGRVLQAVVLHKIQDLELAENLFAGMPRALYLEIEDTRYLRVKDSTHSGFEELGNDKYKKLRELNIFVGQPLSQRTCTTNTAAVFTTDSPANTSIPLSE